MIMRKRSAEALSDSAKPYKALLLRAEHLCRNIQENIYDLAQTLVAIFGDRDWRADNGNVDDFKAADALSHFVGALCLNFFEIRDLLEWFPDRDRWDATPLNLLYDEMMAEKSRSVRSAQSGKSQKRATKADVESAEKEAQRAKAQATFLKRELESKSQEAEKAVAKVAVRESELDKAKARIKELENDLKAARKRIRELERELGNSARLKEAA